MQPPADITEYGGSYKDPENARRPRVPGIFDSSHFLNSPRVSYPRNVIISADGYDFSRRRFPFHGRRTRGKVRDSLKGCKRDNDDGVEWIRG